MKAFLVVVFFASIAALTYLYYSLRKQAIQLQSQRDSLLQEKKVVFDFLHDLGEAFSGAADQAGQDRLLEIVIRYSVRAMGARGGAIFLLDDSRKNLHAAVVEGAFPPPQPPPDDTFASKLASKSQFIEQMVKSQPVKVGEGIIGQVAHTGEPVLVESGANDPRVPKFSQEMWQIDTLMAVPLKLRNETLGVMAVVNKSGESPFTEGDLTVFSSLADQAALSLYNARYQHLQQEKTKMDRDLQIAREIQTLLLAKDPPKAKGFDIAATNVPALEVGGDYFDFYPIDENRVGIGIADVSGKGVPGALLMVMCRSVARSKASGYRTPTAVLKEINRLLAKDMKPGMFISMTYLVLDTAKRELSFARAGHEPPLLVRDNGKSIQPIRTKGMALGIDAGPNFDLLLEEKTIPLKPNEVVVLYTDGITEAMDASGQEFGRENFFEALRVSSTGSSQEILDNICERLKRFVGLHPQHDDMTLVIIKAL